MASREEMIAFLEKKNNPTRPSREEMISFLEKKQKPEGGSKIEAALEGFGEGATLGYLNNLQALAEKPVTAIGNLITGNDVEADDYVTARDSYNRRQAELQKENPGSFAAGQVAGTIASSIPVAKAAQGATVAARALQGAGAGAIYGAAQNTSEQEGEVGNLDLMERGINSFAGGLMGAGSSLGVDALAKGAGAAGKGLNAARNKAGNYFKKGAEDLIENATGATRKQAENYKEGTGRFLLDNKLAGFGDTAEDIAEKTGRAIKSAEDKIDSSLRALDERGVTVSQDKIVENLQKRIEILKEDPSQASLVKNLEGILDDVINTGKSEVKLSAAEQTKRGYNTSARMWDNPKGGPGKQADKMAYRAYKESVEEAAQAADPAIAETFKKGKSEFGLLNPVVDAAEKRAKQLNQSPLGGLLDTTAILGGAMTTDDPLSGGLAGLGAAIARRKISPRMASSLAVTFDGVAKKLLQQPRMAQMAKVDPQGFKAAVFGMINDSAEKSPSMPIPKAAEERPQKGPERWVNDGIETLNQAGVPMEQLEQLKTTQKGRALLMDAQGAKPGSKRLESVLQRIRTASGGQ